VLSEAQGNFRFGKADLNDAMKAELDKLVARLKENPQGVYIEIEGHTDSTGPDVVNERLGLERAEAVRRYLYEQHQVPLQKISVISYGETRPVAPNDTAKGRAENRRIVVKVLA
jgi:outer membrane protein OmpA-like peptidoglycan-associated protein